MNALFCISHNKLRSGGYWSPNFFNGGYFIPFLPFENGKCCTTFMFGYHFYQPLKTVNVVPILNGIESSILKVLLEGVCAHVRI